jgi:transcriptional antiterminator RfaH
MMAPRKRGRRKMNEVSMTISPLAEPYTQVVEPAWYCIRSHLKHEHIAAAHLLLIPDVVVFNPRLRLLRSTRRGRIWSTEPLFPNYLFARFDLQLKLEQVQYTPSVTKVVRFGNLAPAVPDEVIQALQRDLRELKSRVLTDAPEEGEDVEVADGAFKGLTGPVTRVLPAKQRVQILLDFMGRSIAAELSLELVLVRRREAVNLVLPEANVNGGPRPGYPRPAPSVRSLPRDGLSAEYERAAA